MEAKNIQPAKAADIALQSISIQTAGHHNTQNVTIYQSNGTAALAALQAENELLKQQNAWLRKMLERRLAKD